MQYVPKAYDTGQQKLVSSEVSKRELIQISATKSTCFTARYPAQRSYQCLCITKRYEKLKL